MKLNAAGIQLIQSFEDCKLEAYQVKGDVPTIGWGNTFYEDGTAVKLGDKISQKRADQLFAWSLNEVFVPFVVRALRVTLNENQFSALVSYRYNVRPKTFVDSPILRHVNSGNFEPLRKVWPETTIRKGSIFERGLRRRRRAEVNLFFTPAMYNPLPPNP